MLRLALAVFLAQAAFFAFVAPLGVVLKSIGVPLPEIGLVIGAGIVVQIPAALAMGPLIDRFGAPRVFVAGSGAYLLGALIFLAVPPEAGAGTQPYIVARLLHGIGITGILPSAMTMVPGLVPAARRGLALGFVSSAHNLAMAVAPAVALALLGIGSLQLVALATMASVAAAAATARASAISPASDSPSVVARAAGRGFSFTLRRAWLLPLATILLVGGVWGLLQTYLPPAMADRPVELSVFLAAYGLAIMVSRVILGELAERLPPRGLILAGSSLTLSALVLLAGDRTMLPMLFAGLAGGIGSGAVYSPVLVQLAQASHSEDRGSAFSLYGMAISSGLTLGSIGAAPLVAAWGLPGGLAAVGAGVIVAGLLNGASLVRGRARG